MLPRDGFRRAHRWVFWKAHGIKPEVVMHLCDNRACLNLAHLKAGTQKENMADMHAKGRHVGGILLESQTRAIRSRLALGQAQRLIARDLGVKQALVRQVARTQ
jgi:hypothetical protein